MNLQCMYGSMSHFCASSLVQCAFSKEDFNEELKWFNALNVFLKIVFLNLLIWQWTR